MRYVALFREYSNRWIHTILIVVLVLLTVLRENKIFDLFEGRIAEWAELFFVYAYYPFYAVLFIWFVLLSMDGTIKSMRKNDRQLMVEVIGWLVINMCAFSGIVVYIMWH